MLAYLQASGRSSPECRSDFVLRISWESGLEAFSASADWKVFPSGPASTPQRLTWVQPHCFHRPFVLFTHSLFMECPFREKPRVGYWKDIKRYPAFPNWMIYFQVSTRPGIKLLVALRLLTTQGAQASAAGTHTHRNPDLHTYMSKNSLHGK